MPSYAHMSAVEQLEFIEENDREAINIAACSEFFTNIQCAAIKSKSDFISSKVKRDIIVANGITEEEDIRSMLELQKQADLLMNKISNLDIVNKHNMRQPIHDLLAFSKMNENYYDYEKLYEIVQALEPTYKLLSAENDQQYSTMNYRRLVEEMQGSPSPFKKILGGILMAVCVAAAAVIVGCTTVSGVGLAMLGCAGALGMSVGLGFFVSGQGHGLAKAMHEVRLAYAEHDETVFHM